ncbi:unnamed protein product [Parajaminaea phylloscopi]
MTLPSVGGSSQQQAVSPSPSSSADHVHHGAASAPSSASSNPPSKRQAWEPLEKIRYGFAIAAFSPESDVLPQAAKVLDEASAAALQAHLIALEVGDEVYVFEELGSEEAEWVRGYVVSTNRMPPAAAATNPSAGGQVSAFTGHGSASGSASAAAAAEESQVYVGVFPSAHIHIRDHIDDAEMRLAQTYARAKGQTAAQAHLSAASSASFAKPQMETLPEEDENMSSQPNSPTASAPRQSPLDGEVGQRRSYLASNQTDAASALSRPAPPLPSLRCGDETLSGVSEPLADEIACALREWGALMHMYLARGQYSLFESVRQHFDALHTARRQLLAQTLSQDEMCKLRRECVARLVKGNIAQGLDVIVRHPTKGGLVTMDLPDAAKRPEGDASTLEIDDEWVSGIRLYALQAALAYVDQQEEVPRDIHGLTASPLEAPGGNAFGVAAASTSRNNVPSLRLVSPLSRQPRSSFPPGARAGSRQDHRSGDAAVRSLPNRSGAVQTERHNVKYFHVFLEVRAFVANPCSPGETAELYFSLYNKAEARFLTEEYCVILNHHGFPMRKDAPPERDGHSDGGQRSIKMCTLFTNLSNNDMQDLNVVCRIVRNGAMRMAINAAPTAAAQTERRGSQFSHREQPVPAASMPPSDASHEDRKQAKGPYDGLAGFRTKRMTSDSTFRRPFGCAVLSLGQDHQFEIDVSTSSAKKEHIMPILVPVNEAAFSTLHQDIIASRVREIEKSPRAELIAVDVKVFHGEIRSLVKENPSLLSEAALTARLGFPDVVFPDDSRNEAYIKLWSGEFYPASGKIPGATASKNIQVSIEVRTRKGEVLHNVISRGSGQPKVDQFDSTIFYHQNAPTWGELIKLDLPKEHMEQCHLFLSFRHRSSKEERNGVPPAMQPTGQHSASQASTHANHTATTQPPFAYSYLPLFGKNAAFIEDGSHGLFLWRTTRPAQELSPELYFALPSSVPSGQLANEVVPPSLTGLVQPLRDSIMLRSFLVSTRYTQNDVLLKLLHWEKALSEDIEELKSILVKFTFVGEVEIVKFLRDIFDALFAIVVNTRNANGGLDDLVFNALVTVLGIVQDRRFNNFRATLDVYIDHHFHSQTAHTRLMASMARLLADSARVEASKDLRASIKVWPYLFRFILRSRENQHNASVNAAGYSVGAGAVSDHFEATFREDMDALMRSINRLMSATKPPSIVGTQALALQFFADVLPDLASIYSTDELVALETSFADSIFITKGRMVVWKLLHLVHVVSGPLFHDASSRSQLIPSIVRWIRPHLGPFSDNPDEASEQAASQGSVRDTARIIWLEGARLSVTVLAIILDRLQLSLLGGLKSGATPSELRQEQDNVDYILSMVPRILATYREMQSRDTIRSLERHRSPATVASTVPVIFPSTSSFPLIAKRPEGDVGNSPQKITTRRRAYKADRLGFLNCGLGEIAAVLTMLIMLSPRKHLAGFLDEQLDLEGPEKLSQFLADFFHVSTSIIRNEAYPASWLNINILGHQMVLKMADPIASLMVRDFIPTAEESEKFDTSLWNGCLEMLLTLLSSDQLVIEQFQPQRRRAVWRLAGDIRGEGAQIFAKLWNSIGWPDQTSTAQTASSPPSAEATSPSGEDDAGAQRLNTGGFQVQFIPGLVEPVLELCLSHHDELRMCAVRVLATMITSEWHLNSNFAVIEAEIIDKLDVLFMSDIKGDEISRAFFIGQLRSMFESTEVETRLQEQVFNCLLSVNRFLDLLLNVRSLPLTEGYEDDRIAGTLKLLGFLRQADRVTAFSAHVLRLVNLHLSNLNFVEAALTLKLHADLHTWEMDNFVDAIPELCLPRQSHFARRETLYMLILDYLGKGQAWEIAIDICRELAQQYEYRAVDYTRLAELMTFQASLFRKVAQTERTFPAYFRVAYYGAAWPQSLQQKMFIYRGTDWEKLSGFGERMQQKHPAATLLKSSAAPGDEIKYAAGVQYLQITALQPEPDRSRDIFTNPDVPAPVRAYYEHNATNLFSFARPLRIHDETAGAGQKTSHDASSDTVDLWVEKTYLRCEDAFPSVLRRSEVVEVHINQISPLENALNDVEGKTAELVGLERRYLALEEVHQGASAKTPINTNRLSMALNGAVDAPINGGIPRYKRLFLEQPGDDSESHQPDKKGELDAALRAKLKSAINQQAVTISRCLLLHARLCPPEMRPFHETLVRFFGENFGEEIDELGLDGRSDGLDGDGSHPSQEEDWGSEDSGHSSPPPLTRLIVSHPDRRGTSQADGVAHGNNPLSLRASGAAPAQYALNADRRLRSVAGDLDPGLASSPLQLHVALLSRQASIPATLASTTEAATSSVAATARGDHSATRQTKGSPAPNGEDASWRAGLLRIGASGASAERTPSVADDATPISVRLSGLGNVAQMSRASSGQYPPQVSTSRAPSSAGHGHAKDVDGSSMARDGNGRSSGGRSIFSQTTAGRSSGNSRLSRFMSVRSNKKQ